jgi:hypothetical protein
MIIRDGIAIVGIDISISVLGLSRTGENSSLQHGQSPNSLKPTPNTPQLHARHIHPEKNGANMAQCAPYSIHKKKPCLQNPLLQKNNYE